MRVDQGRRVATVATVADDEMAVLRARLGAARGPAEPDLLLAPTFDERRCWEVTSDRIRATLGVPVSRSLTAFLV